MKRRYISNSKDVGNRRDAKKNENLNNKLINNYYLLNNNYL